MKVIFKAIQLSSEAASTLGLNADNQKTNVIIHMIVKKNTICIGELVLPFYCLCYISNEYSVNTESMLAQRICTAAEGRIMKYTIEH